MHGYERCIAHIDMDAFYASVELLRYPDLRGIPLVVGGRRAEAAGPGMPPLRRLRDYQGRGVVTTATYEARALGVHSGMSLMRAGRYAPAALLLAPDFLAYRHYSALFKESVRAIAPHMEDRGIDEVYLDLSEAAGEPRVIGQQIKAAVRAATGLSCSVGLAGNKFLAKIASDLDKPDGLTVLGPEDIPTRVWPLDVAKINGVGPKAAAKLRGLGIATIGELAQTRRELLDDAFGQRLAGWLKDVAHGVDHRMVVTCQAPKSLSRETTFDRDLHARHDRVQLAATLANLCERLSEDLAKKRSAARTIGVKLRYSDFQTVTRDTTQAVPLRRACDILVAARECLRRVPLDQRLRLLGVRATGLTPTGTSALEPAQGELPFS